MYPTQDGAEPKAVVCHKPVEVQVDEVEDPRLEDPTDVLVRITSSAGRRRAIANSTATKKPFAATTRDLQGSVLAILLVAF
jgi:hypothetical protein